MHCSKVPRNRDEDGFPTERTDEDPKGNAPLVWERGRPDDPSSLGVISERDLLFCRPERDRVCSVLITPGEATSISRPMLAAGRLAMKLADIPPLMASERLGLSSFRAYLCRNAG